MPSTLSETPHLDTLPPRIRLIWRVHLLRRDPRRLPTLLLAFALGGGCVWVLFGNWLPVLLSQMLLAGAVSEFLWPITYQITDRGVQARSLTSEYLLTWKEVKRCRPAREGILLSPLSHASRLDNFRGVFLRYAPDGEPGDRASVETLIAEYALPPDTMHQTANATRPDTTGEPA